MSCRYSLRKCLVGLVGTALVLVQACALWAGSLADIQPYGKNPFYWQFRGQPQLLVGGSSEDNLFQLEESALIEELDRLQGAGVNYLRNTLSSRDPGNRWPFAKDGELYDLQRWDDVYWQRLETFLRETARRDMVVQIEFWDPFDYHQGNWRKLNPFNPRLNRTYSVEESGLPAEVNAHPADRSVRHPFFRSVLPESGLDVVLSWQRQLVARVLEHTLRYPHVLYCISNETTVTPAWGKYWADFIRRKAAESNRTVYVTEMWNNWNMRASQHRATFDHPELYDFVDLSQNTHNPGQEHADGVLSVRSRLADRPRPMNAVKIYGSVRGKDGGNEAAERFWRNIFCGMAASRFHRPPGGLGGGELALRQIITVRRLLNNFDLFSARPASSLLGNRRPDEAYALFAEGELAIYFPPPEPSAWWEEPLVHAGQLDVAERSVTLDGVLQGKERQVLWLSPDDSADRSWEPLPAGSITVTAPDRGHWIALVRTTPHD